MGGAALEIWQRLWTFILKQLKVHVPDYNFFVWQPANHADGVHIDNSVNPSCEIQLAAVN